MENVDHTSVEVATTETQENTLKGVAVVNQFKPSLLDPDLDFIRKLNRQSGNPFKKCMQCGTCSATCELSPDNRPFPGKEMAWSAWGLKEKLLGDLDVWLCHQCNDCSVRCPRNARPGDVLAAIRQASVEQMAFPRFLGRWANEPPSILLLLGIPVLILTLALKLKDPIETALGFKQSIDEQIIFAYSHMFPHWLLFSLFFFFSFLMFIAVIVGVNRFWKALKKFEIENEMFKPQKGIWASIFTTFKDIITHSKFSKCNQESSRFWTHTSVLFGFIALSLVAVWIITMRFNPLAQGDFIYPFAFLSPWKILANLGGISVMLGCIFMSKNRILTEDDTYSGSFFDWSLIGILLLVVITGFLSEVLHYVHLEPHRHLIYFTHLVFVLALIIYLPYSKLAHMIYRTTAMVFAEHTGRNLELEEKTSATQPDLTGKEGD